MELLLIAPVAGIIAFFFGRKRSFQKKLELAPTDTLKDGPGLAAISARVLPAGGGSGADAGQNFPATGKGNKGTSDKNHVSGSLDKFAWLSISGEAAWYGAEAIDNLMSVDENVYDALSHLSGQQLESLGDLNNYLDTWNTDLLGNLPDGSISNLAGHVSEYVVAEHLREMGHVVEMPETSNFPGVDMWVDGHPFNVKNVTDISSIEEHFRRYSDVGVISNYDINGNEIENIDFDPTGSIADFDFTSTLPDHAHLYDPGLGHDAVFDQTADATDAILGNIDIHFPIITAGISVYREVKLINKSHTDLKHAAKNVALDVAGVGGGAAIGGKIGATIGTVILPGFGTAIGAGLGAALGGYLGKKATNTIKTAPYENAKATYNASIKNFKTELVSVEAESKKRITDYREQGKRQLAYETKNSRKILASLKKELINNEKNSYRINDNLISSALDHLIEKYNQKIRGLNDRLASIGWFSRVFWPSDETAQIVKIKSALEFEKSELISLKNSSDFGALNGVAKTHIILELTALYSEYENIIIDHLKRFEETRRSNMIKFAQEAAQQKKKIADLRIKFFRDFKMLIELLRREANQKLEPLVNDCKSKAEIMKTEGRRLGLNI
ncbi:MAG: hypothetical protein L6Q59_12525 [Ignavibacteriaceae bacterium]|nr:hypothetical protein [Ignavibacteriaceae bacterium]